jgi:hypothetical protein
MSPKAELTCNFFAPLSTTDMDTETTGTENTLLEQEASRILDRPPAIIMTSTTNLIQLQRDVQDHIEGECKFRNAQNGTCIITK